MGKTLDEIKADLPADRREAIERRTADLVVIERLQSRLAEAERLLQECEGHEGAESWSDYLRRDLDAFWASDNGSELPKHCCGQQGYNQMLGDTCPRCEYDRAKRAVESESNE